MKTRWYSRKKIYANSTERSRAFRVREKAARPAPAVPTTADPKAWDDYLRATGLGISRGSGLAGAPRGKRRLLTGCAIANARR